VDIAMGLMADFDATGVAPFPPMAMVLNELVGGVPDDQMNDALAPEICGASDHPDVLCTTAVAVRAADRGRVADARAQAARDRGLAEELFAEEEDEHAEEHVVGAMIVEGVLAWSEGDRDAALVKLDSAVRTNRTGLGAWRTAAYLAEEGYATDAIGALRTLDELVVWTPFAHLRIAALLEQMGERSEARKYYQSALAAWVEADEGFEPRARAEEGLARITSN
jgi:tetratricopeptide (TPR) repeat protein